MSVFIVSSYYRGAMNVNDLRSFVSKKKAKEYWQKLQDPVVGTRGVRAYKTCENDEPKLLNTEKAWEEA